MTKTITDPISTTVAAAVVGCSVRCVRQMLSDGRLFGRKIGPRIWVVSEKSAKEERQNPAKTGRPRKS
jgi:hypothetical protein